MQMDTGNTNASGSSDANDIATGSEAKLVKTQKQQNIPTKKRRLGPVQKPRSIFKR